jgi:hypothetical protein
MKDGTTRLPYKAEHAVDLDTDIIVAATVHPGNAPDKKTIIDTAIDAAVNAKQAGVENDLQAIVADKDYHSKKVVTLATDLGMRAYIPERTSPKQRCWIAKLKQTSGPSATREDGRRATEASSSRDCEANSPSDAWLMSALPARRDERGCDDSRAWRSGT